MVVQLFFAIALLHGLAQNCRDLPGLVGQHGGLVDHGDAGQIGPGIEPLRPFSRKLVGELLLGNGSVDEGGDPGGLLRVEHDERLRMLLRVRVGRLRLLVPELPVNDDRVALLSQFLPPVPDSGNERAGGVVALAVLLRIGVETCLLQRLLDLQGGAESGDQDDVVGADLLLRDASLPIGVEQEVDAPFLQVVVYEGIVDDLADEADRAAGIFLERGEGHVNCPLDAETEAEMPGNQEFQVAYGEAGGAHRPLADFLAEVLDALNDRPLVMIGHPVEPGEFHTEGGFPFRR